MIRKLDKTQIGSVIPRSVQGNPLFVGRNKKLEQSLNIKEINAMADFPAPIAGVISLESYKYKINTSLVTSDRFLIPDGVFTNFEGYNSSVAGITYAGADTMFSGVTSGHLEFDDMFISGPNATAFNLVSTAGNSFFFFESSGAIDFASMGTIENFNTVSFLNYGYFDIGDGIILTDNDILSFTLGQHRAGKNNTTTLISVSGTGTLTSFNGVHFDVLSNETLLDIDGVYDTGTVTASTFSGAGTLFAAGSKDQTDLNWKYAGNVRIPDSQKTAGLSLLNNATNTTFVAVDTPTLVLGTWTDSAERFTTTSAGRATYIGLEDASLQILANPTAVTGTGTNKDCSYYFIHGNEIDHAITVYADAGGGQVTVTSAAHGLSNGDRVVIRNSTNYNGTFTIANATTDTFEITDTWVADDAAGDWALIVETSKASNQLGSTTKASNTGVLDRQIFTTNDFIELFMENNSDALPLLVKNCNITIS